jgi:hypothetical protein
MHKIHLGHQGSRINLSMYATQFRGGLSGAARRPALLASQNNFRASMPPNSDRRRIIE